MANKYYSSFNFYDIHKDKKFDSSNLIIIDKFEVMKQKANNTCGPCCINMVLNYFGLKTVSEKELAKQLDTQDYPVGTKLHSIVKFFKDNYAEKLKIFSSIDFERDENGLCFSTYFLFKNFVKENLKKSNPIIVENVDFGGHYKVLIGLDDQLGTNNDMLIFADPCDVTDGVDDGYCFYPAEKFYTMWFDDHCLEKSQKKQPFCVISRLEEEKNV